ncbi:uncharacterized protein [Apostichopus japonicus]|uniref:uncharacterized protein n=1 Tax=Stichopus japonicus TaxID=307972 RepID=UPI003AB34768
MMNMEESPPLYCNPCEKQFTGLANLSEHNDSPAHRKAVVQKQTIQDMTRSLSSFPPVDTDGHEALDEFMKTEDQNMFLCELCNITCSGKIPALSHVRGKAHRQKIQRQGLTNAVSLTPESSPAATQSLIQVVTSPDFSVFEKNPVTGHYFCNVCRLSVSGEVPAQQHVQGKSHAKKVKIATGRNDSDLSLSFSKLSVSSSPVSYNHPKTTAVVNPRGHGPASQVELISLDSNSNLNESAITKYGISNPRELQRDELQVEDEDNRHDETDVDFRITDGDFNQDLEINKMTGQWHCKVCQVPLNSQKTIQQHFLGKTHHKKKKASGIRFGEAETGGFSHNGSNHPEELEFDESLYQWRCRTCNVFLSTEISAQEHLSDKAHLIKKASKTGPSNSSPFDQRTMINDSLNGGSFQVHNVSRIIEQSGSHSRSGISLHSLSFNQNQNTQSTQPLLSNSFDSSIEGRQAHHVAWERSPCLDENDQPSNKSYLMETSAIGNVMSSDAVTHSQREMHLPETYREKRQVEGLGFDPATSSSSSSGASPLGASPYTLGQRISQDISNYWPVNSNTAGHNASVQQPQATSNTAVRPPPGFGQDFLPSNRPMSDFLAHQLNATVDPPSYMHRFWSMPSDQQTNLDSLGVLSSVESNRALISPIGTPFAGKKIPGQVPPSLPQVPMQGDMQQKIGDAFRIDGEKQKLVCKICDIFVTGNEAAEAHLKGAKHAKKLRAYQFQMHHLEPQPSHQNRRVDEDHDKQQTPFVGSSSSSLHSGSTSGTSTSTSDCYDYNFSSGGSNSSTSGGFSADKMTPVHQEGGLGGDNGDSDRPYHSLRGVSLMNDTH